LGFGLPSGAHPCDRDHEDDRRREQHGPVDEEKSGSGTVLSASEAPDGSQVARAAHDQGGESEKDERETEPGEVRVCRTRRVEENGQLAKEEIELLDHETKGDETDARTDPGEERALGGEIGTGIGGFVHGDRRGSVIVDRSRRGTGMQAFGSRRGLFVPCPEGASPARRGRANARGTLLCLRVRRVLPWPGDLPHFPPSRPRASRSWARSFWCTRRGPVRIPHVLPIDAPSSTWVSQLSASVRGGVLPPCFFPPHPPAVAGGCVAEETGARATAPSVPDEDVSLNVHRPRSVAASSSGRSSPRRSSRSA
jgi:hypothetical protein